MQNFELFVDGMQAEKLIYKPINHRHLVYFKFDLVFSLHVKALLARTVLFVFLNMNGTPITVTVSLDSVEPTVDEEVLNMSFSFLL